MGRNRLLVLAAFAIAACVVLWKASSSEYAVDLDLPEQVAVHSPTGTLHRRNGESLQQQRAHVSRDVSTSLHTQQQDTGEHYVRNLQSTPERSCLASVHSRVSKWLSCIDASVPYNANTLQWSDKNNCHFYNFKSFDDPTVVRLFATSVVEAHGDSTLRELVKLLIGGLRMDGTLDKRDASATLRYPKYFMRLLSNGTMRPSDVGTDGEHPVVVAAADGSRALRQATPKLRRWLSARCTPAKPHLLPVRWCPLMYRIMFRFDFVPSSFFEPLGDTVPTYTIDAGGASASVGFFDRAPLRRVLLLATGSHTAKMLLMNSSTKQLGKRLAEPRSEFSKSELFTLIIRDVERYLVLRLLGLEPSAAADSRGIALVPVAPSSGGDAALQPVSYAVIFLETLECSSMMEAKLAGFREMSPYCDTIKHVVHRVNDELERYFLADYEGGDEESRRGLHDASLLRLLSIEQLAQLRSSVFLVPFMECHAGNRFQYSPTRPYCTKDGIHLRTKFIKQKLNLLLNLMQGVDECSFPETHTEAA